MTQEKYILLNYNMTDFFSGSKPDLISMKSMNDLVEIVIDGGGIDNVNNALATLTKPSSFDIKTIYMEYIRPNILAIIIITVFSLCVLFRYFSLKEKDTSPIEKTQPDIQVNLPVLYDLEEINKMSEEEIFNKMTKKN